MTKNKSVIREYVEAILIAVVLALFIRHFIVQAFKIPSGSMIPTLLVGDHLLVNKFIYRFRAPRRGEIIVFKWPRDRKTDFIKRVIGLPGDDVSLREGVLSVNGEEIPDAHARYGSGRLPGRERNFSAFHVPRAGETIVLNGEHLPLYELLIENETGEEVDYRGNALVTRDGRELTSYTVKGNYLFMMGDNRDNSSDSRFWGPVMIDDVVGRAMVIYWSFGESFFQIRWARIGDVLH